MKKMVLYSVVIFMITGLSVFGASVLFSESEKILARVGEKVITQDDLDELVKMSEPLRRGQPATLEDKKNLLDKLLRNILISTEAEKEKLDQKPEFQRKLKMYRDELLASEYVAAKIAPSISVTNEEVEKILSQNPNLIPKGILTLREILVKTEKEAGEIYQELKKGADFSKTATEKSIAQSKANGGLLGAISKGQLPPFFAEAVSLLKEGEFSKPIKTDEGFLILYLVNRKETPPEQIKILEGKVRGKIFQLEKNKRIEALLEKKVEELKKQVKVETYFDQLK